MEINNNNNGNVINTISSITAVDLDTFSPEPSIDGKGSHGGYCGPAVKPIALNMVAEIARDAVVFVDRHPGQLCVLDHVAKPRIKAGAIDYSQTVELDLASVVPSLAGPKRPQDKVALTQVDNVFNADLASVYKKEQSRVAVAGASRTSAAVG